ncbi:MAG TPA: hypothetical protein VLJ59_20110 [Mycobacteriales bacterium]|nr:hypothetical protein [Mycobacteriales bacterium]
MAPAPAGPWFAWRLIGANSRELGRSAQTYADLATCWLATARLRRRLDDTDQVVTPHKRTGEWTWRLEIDGVAVAVAAPTYLRQRECAYNLTQFLAAPVARITDQQALLTRPVEWQARRPRDTGDEESAGPAAPAVRPLHPWALHPWARTAAG